MPKIINVHTLTMAEGFGDLVYFLNWFKMYRKYNKGQDDRILIFASPPLKIAYCLYVLKEREPNHPIFEFVDISFDNHSKQYAGAAKDPKTYVVTSVRETPAMAVRLLQDYFPDICDEDYVNLIYVSCIGDLILKNSNADLVDHNEFIIEFEGLTKLSAQLPQLGIKMLGLADDNLGILTDIDGITGNEEIGSLLGSISKETKQLIFANENISATDAEHLLSSTPTVFAYLQQTTDIYVLHALLRSPLIQEGIAHGKQPLFVITQLNLNEELPDSIQQAINDNQIKFVNLGWLKAKEYHAVNGLFLNRNTQSIIVPCGDTSLSTCIKAGKLPFYAHVDQLYFDRSAEFKCAIFKSMLQQIIKGLQDKIFPDNEGAVHCFRVLSRLTKHYINSTVVASIKDNVPFLYGYFLKSNVDWNKRKYHEERGKYLTQDALNFFRDHLAPFIMREFDFETRSLPGILARLNHVDVEQVLTSTAKNRTVQL